MSEKDKCFEDTKSVISTLFVWNFKAGRKTTMDFGTVTYTAEDRIATIFDGITRHSPEGVWFKNRAEEVGFKLENGLISCDCLANLHQDCYNIT